MLRETTPAAEALPYQASFALGDPYVLDPGPATRRAATSACTKTKTLEIEGKLSRK
ncbi:unannotated protein [freshwater metagenome]|uniref:Unannotated protein n=1 Tax=freshwater metagenome TaxID=449393 RepID=A0A6J7CTN4_9ZZZZ